MTAATVRHDPAYLVNPGAGDPPEPATGHDDCECEVCYPPCAADGCSDPDVTARLVPLPTGGWSRTLLCDAHGLGLPTEALQGPATAIVTVHLPTGANLFVTNLATLVDHYWPGASRCTVWAGDDDPRDPVSITWHRP